MRAQLKTILVIGSGAALTQGLTAITGLLLVRWLSVDEYALYTIVIMTMGAISLVSRGGANTGFTASLGRIWPNPKRAGEIIAALMRVRLTLMRWLMVPVLVATGFLLMRSGSDIATCVIIVLLMILFWIADLKTRVVDQILFFAGLALRVNTLDAVLAIARLTTIATLFALGGLDATSAVLVGVLLALARVPPITRWVKTIAPQHHGKAPAQDIAVISLSVRRHFATEAFFAGQTAIVLAILALTADAAAIAGFGALLRLGALLGPVRVLNNAVFVPIIARKRNGVAGAIIGTSLLMMMPGLCLTLIALTAPDALLWLLGNNYAHLQREVVVMALAVTFMQAGGEFWSLIAHRGWVRFSALQILIGAIWLGVATFVLDLTTISGALVLLAGFTIGTIITGLFELWRHRKPAP